MDWLLYEKKYSSEGKKLICGVDEAGRGPLAGPVYAAAVILPYGKVIEGVNDSKKLSPRKREKLYDEICKSAISYAVSSVSAEKIDEINILRATHLAMINAVESLTVKPDFTLVDGNILPNWEYAAEALVKGDALSHSIACASILAKVSRDRFMIEKSEEYPLYGFKKHKGYGTKLHIEMIKNYGPCPLHRRTFLSKIINNV